MMRIVLVLLAMLIAAPALAQGNGPVEISSDNFFVDEAKREATFSGNVVVTRTNLTVWADSVVINYGTSGIESISEMVATGKVRIKTAEQDASGERAVFNPTTQVLVLTGNVIVVSGSGTVAGPRLEVNLADNTSIFSAGNGQRVTGVFTAQ